MFWASAALSQTFSEWKLDLLDPPGRSNLGGKEGKNHATQKSMLNEQAFRVERISASPCAVSP